MGEAASEPRARRRVPARGSRECARDCSWARRLRFRCFPSPAASSIRRRRSRGFELTICSTRPWLITECISRPRLVSERASTTSASRQRAPFSRYSPSPLRSIRRSTEISENSLFARPSELSITTSTSANRRRCWPFPPAKITSCIVWPRTAVGLCSPRAQRTASVMFDLPQPFGPTITLTPGENVSRVRSGNDLNPLRLISFRYISSVGGRRPQASRLARTGPLRAHLPSVSSACSAAACSACFLLRPEPTPISSPSTLARTSKRRSCGGPASLVTP